VAYPLGTTFIDYPDNESLAVIIYFMGCEQNCKKCHNPDFRDPYFHIGTKVLKLDIILNELMIFCNRNKTDKIVLSGGDPLHPNNAAFTKILLEELTKGYKVAIYTSYSKECIQALEIKGFTYIKSGVFNENLYQTPIKTDAFIRFASKNQNLYDADFNLISQAGTHYFNPMR
jgi:organic radical activating enzyme